MHRGGLLIWFIAFCLIVIQTDGQDLVKLDSLQRELISAPSDRAKIPILNDLAFMLIEYHQDSSRFYANEAYLLAEALNDSAGKASAYMRLGGVNIFDGTYEQADSFFHLALAIRENLDLPVEIASTYNNIGLIQFYLGDDRQAITFYEKGLSTLKGKEMSQEEGALCYNIGESYMFLGEDKEAIKYFNRALAINETINEPRGIANSLMSIANWYDKMENYKKAFESYNEALNLFKKINDKNGQAKCHINMGDTSYKLGESETALQQFEAALRLKSFLDKPDAAFLYQIQGSILSQANEKEKALTSFFTSLELFKDLNSIADVAAVNFNIGLLYKSMLNYKIALTFYQDTQSILDTIENPSLDMALAQEFTEVYTRLKQPDLALQYSQKYNILQDSLNDNYRLAMNYKIDYEVLKKEHELELLKNEKKNFTINAFIVLGVLWFLLSGATIMAYFNRRKRRIAEEQTKAAYLEIDGLLKDQQLQTTYAKLEGQDEERIRIAQDLHDRVGSILSTVMLYFKGFDTKLDAIQSDNQGQLVKANELLDKAVVEVRKISQNIHSGTLTKFGLEAELNALADILKASNHIKVKVVTYGMEERLPVSMEIKVYRIIQELVSNVLKHANATEIVIQVNLFKDVLNVSVEDDGKGFDLEEAKKKNSMGLKNIESRVHALHGSIIIDSVKGRGTAVLIDIPPTTKKI